MKKFKQNKIKMKKFKQNKIMLVLQIYIEILKKQNFKTNKRIVQ